MWGVESPHGQSPLIPLVLPPAPDPVTITSCSSASGGYKVVVTWSCPPGGYEAFELEVGRQRVSQPPSSCGKGVSMSGLGPAKSYPAVVTTLWDGMRAQSASVTCHTESAGEQSPMGTGSFDNLLSKTPSGPVVRESHQGRGNLLVCVSFPAFFKTALLRCTPGNIRPIIHLKCTAQWLLVYSQCLHHRHCQFKVFSLLRREVISAWSVLCTVNKPN